MLLVQYYPGNHTRDTNHWATKWVHQLLKLTRSFNKLLHSIRVHFDNYYVMSYFLCCSFVLCCEGTNFVGYFTVKQAYRFSISKYNKLVSGVKGIYHKTEADLGYPTINIEIKMYLFVKGFISVNLLIVFSINNIHL